METEVFVFGGLCVMAEGRCALSSYATGESPNMNGVCSPASHVRYVDEGDRLVSRLGEYTINAFEPEEAAGYPTLCKGRFVTEGETNYLFEEPTSLNALEILPELKEAGRDGAEDRRAASAAGPISRRWWPPSAKGWMRLSRRASAPAGAGLAQMTEGQRNTTGAYQKSWR